MNKELYYKGLKKGKRRQLGIIRLLIRKEDFPQKNIPKMIEKDIDEKINYKILSEEIKKLKLKEIIKTKPFYEEGRGPARNKVFIPKDYQTLVKLIGYLYSIKDIPFLLNLKKSLIHSKYIKDVVNQDFVLKIQSNLKELLKEKYGNVEFDFKKEEKCLILIILQNSPSALYYATNLYYEDLIEILDYNIWNLLENTENKSSFEEVIGNKLKERFIFNLQAYLGEDISKIGSNEPLEHITSTIFLQNEIMEGYYYCDVHLSQVIKKDKVKNAIKTHSKIKMKDISNVKKIK